GIVSIPVYLVIAAFILCTYIYQFNPAMADRIRRFFGPVYVILDRTVYFDDFNQTAFARWRRAAGRLLWHGGDGGLLDAGMVNGSTRMVGRLSAGVRRMQSGLLYHYAFAMIIGLIIMLGGFWWFGTV